jgi:hypothetical protein
MDLSLFKYALTGAMRFGKYLRKSKKQKGPVRERKPKKGKLGRRLAIVGVVLVTAIGLIIGLAAQGMGLTGGNQNSTADTAQQLAQVQAVFNYGSKQQVLRTSSTSVLTAYPDNNSNALSSATVDEKTGNQSYMRNAGSGGVALVSVASANPDDPCAPVNTGGLGGITSRGYKNQNGVCTISGDFLIGGSGATASGALINIPLELTSQSVPIHTFLTAMKNMAWALLVMIILAIGVSTMVGGGSFRHADMLETLPRLIFSVIGVAICEAVAEQILLFTNAITEWIVQLGTAAGGVSITGVVYPSSVWMTWLGLLMFIGIGFLAAQTLAPLAILGTTYGPAIAIPLMVILYGLMIGFTPQFIITGFSMIIGVEVVVRIILIDLYIILSPVAIISAGLPGKAGVGFARDWIFGFLGLVASHFAQAAVLVLGMIVMGGYLSLGGKSDIILLFMKYGTLVVMIRVPGLFKSNAAELLKQVGPTVAGAVQQQTVIFMPK